MNTKEMKIKINKVEYDPAPTKLTYSKKIAI